MAWFRLHWHHGNGERVEQTVETGTTVMVPPGVTPNAITIEEQVPVATIPPGATTSPGEVLAPVAPIPTEAV